MRTPFTVTPQRCSRLRLSPSHAKTRSHEDNYLKKALLRAFEASCSSCRPTGESRGHDRGVTAKSVRTHPPQSWFHRRLVQQHDRYVVLDREHALALRALQRGAVLDE